MIELIISLALLLFFFGSPCHTACRCDCLEEQRFCHNSRHSFNSHSCQCECKEEEEYTLCRDQGRLWDNQECVCSCPVGLVKPCSTGWIESRLFTKYNWLFLCRLHLWLLCHLFLCCRSFCWYNKQCYWCKSWEKWCCHCWSCSQCRDHNHCSFGRDCYSLLCYHHQPS